MLFWDDAADPDGNVRHCLEHGVHWWEVRQVVNHPDSFWDDDEGRGPSPKYIVRGVTKHGRPLVVHGYIYAHPPRKGQFYTITAYDP
jgi:hypothetical protein